MNFRCYIALCLIFCMTHAGLAQNQAGLEELYRQAAQLEQSNDAAGAVRLYGQAVGLGHTPSMVRLGYLRQEGIGGPRDLAGGVTLFLQAAKAGNSDGEFMLAMACAHGVGTRKDPAVARQWLLQAAGAGHQYAQFALGIMLQTGEGGPKKETAARRWMDRAAAGPDKSMAARAAAVRDRLDKMILAPDNSGGALVGLILFMALAGAVLGGGSGGGGPVSSSAPFGGGSGSSAPSERPCHPVPVPWFGSSTPNGKSLIFPSPQSSMRCL